MYLPRQFREERVPVLHDAIAHAGIATFVTTVQGRLEASHVPMLLERDEGALGTLYGHVARANRQWDVGPDPVPALAMFLGPDAYVSPSWYPTKQRTGEVVPTWNYVAVHAQGAVRFFDDPDRLLALVSKLTALHEGPRATPWKVSDAPEAFIRSQLRAIVGFALAIERLEGKWKMSQNRSQEDRDGVADGLERAGRPDVAALLKERPPRA